MRGRPKWLTSGGEELIVKVSSQFTLNQISGQVIEHQEVWDLSASSSIAQLFFWTSCRLLATIDTTKDLGDLVKGFSSQKPDVDTYPQPSVDPTKVIFYLLDVHSSKHYFCWTWDANVRELI